LATASTGLIQQLCDRSRARVFDRTFDKWLLHGIQRRSKGQMRR
jgi:hypothetical protein